MTTAAPPQEARRAPCLGMRSLIIVLTVLVPALAHAGTECSTRKSGSVTITSCSSSKHQPSTTCRSYRSGSVVKTTCR